MRPVGPTAGVLLARVTVPTETPIGAGFAGCGGVNAIGCDVVRFGVATAGAFGGITFTLTKGGLEFAHAIACRLVSKNLSITIAFFSFELRPARRAALRFRTALPVSTAARVEPSGNTTRLP